MHLRVLRSKGAMPKISTKESSYIVIPYVIA